MKRSYLRRKSKSAHSKLIKECDDLLLAVLKKERGLKCELCGSQRHRLGRFHILPDGTHPRVRYSKENVLLVGWQCCHYYWHHDYHKGKEIEKEIIRLRGENYRDKLLILERMMPTLATFRLRMIKLAFEKQLEDK